MALESLCFLFYNTRYVLTFFGGEMLRDVEIRNPDPAIQAREFALVRTPAGRVRYPFKRMIVGDYFRVYTMAEATAARNALQSFYKRTPGRVFTTRQRDDGEWVCRRVA